MDTPGSETQPGIAELQRNRPRRGSRVIYHSHGELRQRWYRQLRGRPGAGGIGVDQNHDDGSYDGHEKAGGMSRRIQSQCPSDESAEPSPNHAQDTGRDDAAGLVTRYEQLRYDPDNQTE